jgi:hypothetical protein
MLFPADSNLYSHYHENLKSNDVRISSRVDIVHRNWILDSADLFIKLFSLASAYIYKQQRNLIIINASFSIKKKKTKLRGFSPQAKYADRANAACQRS